jgi:hypothetical protein
VPATSPASSTPSATGSSSLRDAIVGAAAVKRKPPNWIERLNAEQREEIESIKRDWLAGAFHSSALSLAKSIVDNCRERGIPTCGPDGVRAWLGN